MRGTCNTFGDAKVLNNDIKGTENFIFRGNSIIPPGLASYIANKQGKLGNIIFFFFLLLFHSNLLHSWHSRNSYRGYFICKSKFFYLLYNDLKNLLIYFYMCSVIKFRFINKTFLSFLEDEIDLKLDFWCIQENTP